MLWLGSIRGRLRSNLTSIVILLATICLLWDMLLLCACCISGESKLLVACIVPGRLAPRIFVVEALKVVEQDRYFDIFLVFWLFFFWWNRSGGLVVGGRLCGWLSVTRTCLNGFSVEWLLVVHSAWGHYLLIIRDVVLVVVRFVLVGLGC